jgi:crossover junction endodeoxyribonuclease RuvC
MIVLGIDPGLADTGWGILKKEGLKSRYIAHGCIKTNKEQLLEERLRIIYEECYNIISLYKPQVAAMETLYFSKNTSSAMQVAHARGVTLLALNQHSIKVQNYTPNTIKQAVAGSGQADKETIQNMMKVLLGLKELPKPHHAADALAAALCANNGGQPTSF